MHWVSHLTIKGYQIGHADFLFINPCWLFLITFLLFTYLEMVSRKVCMKYFLGTSVHDQPVVPWILPLAFLEDWRNICFLPVQSTGNCSNYHSLSKIIESDLARICQLPQHLWMPPIRMSNFFLIFSNLIPLHQKWVFLALDFPTGLRVLRLLKTELTSKVWGEGGVEHIGLFYVLCYLRPCSIQQWTHTFPSLPSAADAAAEALISLHVSHQIQFQVDFGFSNFICTCLETVSKSSWFTCPSSFCFFFNVLFLLGAPS